MRRGTVLLCTLGPSSLQREVIAQLEHVGVYSFRLNMSHTELTELERHIELIQSSSHVPVCIDTEGSQMRTGVMPPGAAVREGSTVRLVPETVEGTSTTIPLTPGSAIGRLAPSARMSIDFDSVVVQIDRVADGTAEGTVVTGGEVGTRKAVTAYPAPQLPAFSEKDLQAIRVGVSRGVQQYALSFCEQPSSLHQLRELVGPHATIMAKIESRTGVRNLARIAEAADALLIDRGDLSREVRLEAIPLLQKTIIRKANALGVPIYVATNLLESMVTRRTPTRAEVNDVMSTLLDGANGLVLASETAIGKYPVSAAKMIRSLIREYEQSIDGYRVDELLGEHPLATASARRLGADHD
ncbi:MAG TPA: pyruvate kinase [Thermoplasmata archaeon]|nr:pyruvate kinase [Thermoplasmata archaeon]